MTMGMFFVPNKEMKEYLERAKNEMDIIFSFLALNYSESPGRQL